MSRSSALAALFREVRGIGLIDHSDSDLLGRFVDHDDRTAFAELVHRLAPTVWGVCRGILRDGPDAEDAFQISFTVLFRKASSVNPRSRLTAWMVGVAQLASRKILAKTIRNSRMETYVARFTELAIHDAPTKTETSEENTLLFEELDKLPEKYRLPILHCGLREQTLATAATELGWPIGTVASRLHRARQMLADRLTRRGVRVAGALVALDWIARVAQAKVPSSLIQKTLLTSSTGEMVSPALEGLLSEVTKTMLLSKIRLFVGAAVITAASLMVGIGSYQPTIVAAPVPAVASTDPLERVKAQRLIATLKNEDVQTELKLDDKQKKSLDELRTKAKEQANTEFQNEMNKAGPGIIPAVPPGGGAIQINVVVNPMEIYAKASKSFDKKAIDLLKPEQLKRLKQLQLLAAGPQAYLDRHVIRALGLTAEQEDKIEEILNDPKTQLPSNEVLGIGGVELSDDQIKETEAKLKKVQTGIDKVLTDDQKAKWKKLVGTPITTKTLLKLHGANDVYEMMNVEGVEGAPGFALPIPGGAFPIPVPDPMSID